MEPIKQVTSPTIVLPDQHIDTDRIIPARFLTTTSSEGLGEHAFSDWRRDPTCPINDERAKGAQILVAGRNFGCGSSREHAAWALRDMGIRVVISSEIADIFRANATRNGILPIVADEQSHAQLMANPFQTVTVDLEAKTVTPQLAEPFGFDIDGFARTCLLEGTDHLGYLLKHTEAIERFDRMREAYA